MQSGKDCVGFHSAFIKAISYVPLINFFSVSKNMVIFLLKLNLISFIGNHNL